MTKSIKEYDTNAEIVVEKWQADDLEPEITDTKENFHQSDKSCIINNEPDSDKDAELNGRTQQQLIAQKYKNLKVELN